jgi:hypothetical protein
MQNEEVVSQKNGLRKFGLLIALVLFASPLVLMFQNATPTVTCTATNQASWVSCKNQLLKGLANTVIVNGTINCPDASCNLNLTHGDTVRITSTTTGVFNRTGGFNQSLLAFSNITNLEVSNLTLQEPANIPIQLTPGAAEVNKYCVNYANDTCGSLLSVSGNKTVMINNVRLINGKRFGLALSNNETATLKNSLVQNAFWFGVWGGSNKYLTILANRIEKNRSNGILMSFGNSVRTLISGNDFNQNHRATAFHSCGSTGKDPCPGGQIDFSGAAQNITLEYNIFENGAMSGEFPEDAKHNWVSGIEFEPHTGNILNVKMNGNFIHNNSGPDFFVNMPDSSHQSTFKISLSVTNNRFCNNKDQGNHFTSAFKWGSGISLVNNTVNCDVGSSSTGKITTGPIHCVIPVGKTTCSTSVTWTTTNAPRACVFLKESKKLLGCGTKANTTVNWISRNPTTFEVHSERNIYSKLMSSAVSSGVSPTEAAPEVKAVGLGCAGNICIWASGYNFVSGCTASLRDPNWNVIALIAKPTCQPTVVTFEIPAAIRAKYSSLIVVVSNPNGKWSSPIGVKIK